MRMFSLQLKRRFSHLAVLLVLLVPTLLYSGTAFALNPKKTLTQYVHDVWTVEDGLPQNSILCITQTRDGYLWVGRWSGLARFDGVRFTIFNVWNTPALRSNSINALAEDREGYLWILGLTRFRTGKFTPYSLTAGHLDKGIPALLQDREGNLWIGTNGGGLNRLKDDKFSNYTTKNGLAGNIVAGLGWTPAGDLWIPTEDGGVSRFSHGRLTDFTTQLQLTSGGIFARVGLKRNLSHGLISAIHEDRQGRVWIGTIDRGMICFSGRKVTRHTEETGLMGNPIVIIYEDRQGTIWIGTHGGVTKFKEGNLTAVTTKVSTHCNGPQKLDSKKLG